MQLIEYTTNGLYVAKADVYIDPSRPVDKAFITHGHGDHLIYGCKSYVVTQSAMPVIKHRLGSHVRIHSMRYQEVLTINGVQFSFHPAGHIIGSAQIKVEYRGEIWVVSGDYKLEDDGLAEKFESVRCHTFITESTFGLSNFKWKKQKEIFGEINSWWTSNKEEGKVSILGSYALGKAQRVIQNVDDRIGKIYTHGSVENINQIFRSQGVPIRKTYKIKYGQKASSFTGGLIIAPPTTVSSSWIQRFADCSIAIASGWMRDEYVNGNKIKRFELSDHADFDGLVSAVHATEATKVYVIHGQTEEFALHLKSIDIDAEAFGKDK